MINRKHLIREDKIINNTIFLSSLKRIIQICCSKNFYKLYHSIFFAKTFKEKFVLDTENYKTLDNIEEVNMFLKKLNLSDFNTSFKNTNKRLLFGIENNKYFFLGLYILKEKIVYPIDFSIDYIEKCLSSNLIHKPEMYRLDGNYLSLYNEFVIKIKNTFVEIKTEKGNTKISLETFFSNKKIEKNKKIVYKNKKCVYNSLKLYDKIINKSEISYDLFKKVENEFMVNHINLLFTTFIQEKINLKENFVVYDDVTNNFYKFVKNYYIEKIEEENKKTYKPFLPVSF